MRTTEGLGPQDRAAIIAVCNAANDTDAFHELFSLIPSGGRHFFAYDGDSVVSHAVVTTRWAQPDRHKPLETAYVDAVATSPAHQGRGHASAVMRSLADGIDDYEIGCLQTDKAGFYERLGWELWRGPLAGREEDGSLTPTPHQKGVMVLRLPSTPAIDPGTTLTIERQPSRIWE